MSLYLVSMGCGEYKSDRSTASDAIEISFGLARGVFYQDDKVYEKELVFRNVEGQAIFEGDVVLGKVDQGFSKVLVFDLPSVKDGASDFSQSGDGSSLAFGLQGESLFVYDPSNPNLNIQIQESGTSELAGITLDQSFNTSQRPVCFSRRRGWHYCASWQTPRIQPNLNIQIQESELLNWLDSDSPGSILQLPNPVRTV